LPPPGRADDFSWPRSGNERERADVAPEPVALTPAAAKKGRSDAQREEAGAARRSSQRDVKKPVPPM
jgi:hypothetical protein